MATPNAPVLGGRRPRPASTRPVRQPRQDAPRARGRAGRAGRAPPGTHATKTRGHGRRRPREAVAPEGHRPRPRRARPARRSWTGGGVVFGPQPRNYTGKVNRKARRSAAIALSRHAAGRHAAVVDGPAFEEAKTKPCAELLGRRLAPPLVIVVIASEEHTWRPIVPQPEIGTHVLDARRARGRTMSSGRASLAYRSRAERRSRRRGLVNGDSQSSWSPPVVSEKSYGSVAERRKYTFKVPPGRQQDPGPAGGRGDLRRQGDRGQHLKVPPSRSGAASTSAAVRLEEGGRHARRRPADRASSRGCKHAMAVR